jgi:hypothetical protein
VAALFAAAFGKARSMDAEEIRSWLHNEELRSEWLRVLERDGRVVGYGDIWVQDEELALDAAAPGLLTFLTLFEGAGMHVVDRSNNWVLSS